ncbi:AraC family transcriptional regulator [Lewinellaceae bacterium SD302]|nr:AraC family transcriptional regulator [Lewinellaceae bacterium SD302]
MQQLSTGSFFGQHYQKTRLGEITLTDTEYLHDKVDWHYHEQPYFTYLLAGKLFEANKRDSYQLTPGCLLFHNWQDAHYNEKPPGFARGFHVELNPEWFEKFSIKAQSLEGSMHLKHPLARQLMNRVFLETKTGDAYTELNIESHLLDIFSTIGPVGSSKRHRPSWTDSLLEIITESAVDELSLTRIAGQLGIHPTHLSRAFSQYFGCNLGSYVRSRKLNQAFALILGTKGSMTEIAYQCGFYDQSHFTANFKRIYGMTPAKLSRQIREC